MIYDRKINYQSGDDDEGDGKSSVMAEQLQVLAQNSDGGALTFNVASKEAVDNAMSAISGYGFFCQFDDDSVITQPQGWVVLGATRKVRYSCANDDPDTFYLFVTGERYSRQEIIYEKNYLCVILHAFMYFFIC